MQPTREQQRAIDLFASGGDLRLDAYAGAGKTSTLAMMASCRSDKGLYLAFNRSIANEAKTRFPAHVRSSTGHSIAFREVRGRWEYTEEKLVGKLTAQAVADAFRLPQLISFHCGLVLPGPAFGAVLHETIKRFLHSADAEPAAGHVPQIGALAGLSAEQFRSFGEQASSHAAYLWKAMRDLKHQLPLGHDGYLKLWSQAEPKPLERYILVDEAQDLNPALLHAIKQAGCQVVYVGDPYQQIYEWRGAVNAMELVQTPHHALLSQSFRFGKEIAAAASIVLRTLGAKVPVRGLASIESHIGRVRPQAILCRSNAGVIGNVLQVLKEDRRCHIVGGTAELQQLLMDVARIQAGQPARSIELLGFADWRAVMRASVSPEGTHLRALVTLVKEYGVAQLLGGLSACVGSENEAEVVCSTAHKAKGREWDYVQLDSDFETGFTRAVKLPVKERSGAISAETRLVYVALTRAKLGVQLPCEITKRFGIRNTIEGILSG